MKRRIRKAIALGTITATACLAGATDAAVDTRPTGAALGAGPTGVRLVYFRATGKKATKTGRPVAIAWRTGEEASLLGFNVYRQVKTKQTKLNRTLIPGKRRTGGGVYTLADRLPKPLQTACYRLQLLGLDGSKVWVGRTCSK